MKPARSPRTQAASTSRMISTSSRLNVAPASVVGRMVPDAGIWSPALLATRDPADSGVGRESDHHDRPGRGDQDVSGVEPRPSRPCSSHRRGVGRPANRWGRPA